MLCPTCNTKNNYYHRFCFQCGAPLNDKSKTDSQMEEPLPKEQESQSPLSEVAPIVEKSVEYSDTEDLSDAEQWNQAAEDHKQETPRNEEQPDDWSKLEAEQDKYPIEESENDSGQNGDNWMEWEDPEQEAVEGFNIHNQIPLRRYRKTEDSKDGFQRLIKACISIVLLTLIGVLVYIGYDQLVDRPANEQPIIKRIDLQYQVEETELNGQPARRIVVQTTSGEQIKILDKMAPVLNGQAEFVLPDKNFALKDYEQQNGALQVSLIMTAVADGFPDRKEEISFEVPIYSAPLEIISPSGKEALVEGNSYQLILKTLPDSDIFINDNNYIHLLNEQGQLSLPLEVPDQPETRFDIRISAKGYEDTIDTVVLKRRQMEFPLVVDQKIPIQADVEGEWVEITGNTHPEATLITNLALREDPEQDEVTGDFKFFVKVSSKGYTPFVLTAKLDGKEDSVLEMIIQRPVSEGEYTRSAWAPIYQELKDFPNLHNGMVFVFTGNITSIESSGTKTSMLVNVAAEGQPEQPIHVEYWKAANFTPGQKIRLFGNRWNNKDGIPFILAGYVYRESE